MTDAQVERKMKKIVELCNELHAEAQARYGREGFLFYESEGTFHLMDGDSVSGIRNQHSKVQSPGICDLQCGAW